MMIVKRILPLLLVAATATALPAQTPTPRAHQLAGEFNKLKNAHKQKHGASLRKYHEVVADAWVAQNSEYAGRYVSDGPELELRVARDGSASGSGVDVAPFTIRASVSNGILTGTRVYRSGRSEPFEAVFMIRSDRADPNDAFRVSRGIGYIMDQHEAGAPVRVFARRQ
jgi:hypothetical protein